MAGKKIPIAHEQSELTVGNYYLVAHAQLKNNLGQIEYIPIIPNEHMDPQFGVRVNHIHIDGRFNMPSVCRTQFHLNPSGKTNVVVTRMEGNKINSDEQLYHSGHIEYKRRKCKRNTTGLDIPDTAYDITPNHRYIKWYKTMIGKSCKGRKCPHLGTTMTQRDNILICPLHNLHGSIEEEVIIAPNTGIALKSPFQSIEPTNKS